jgi:hypothetical protein
MVTTLGEYGVDGDGDGGDNDDPGENGFGAEFCHSHFFLTIPVPSM